MVALVQLIDLRQLFTCSPVTLKCLLNRVQKILIPKRLCQKLDGPRLQGPNRHWHVSMRRDKNDGGRLAQFCQLSLEIEPTHLGQPHIKHQAARVGGAWLFEKLLARCKDLGTKAN